MRILVTGAGVAGLSAAAALRGAGAADVTLVERASEVAAQGGTGVAIPPNGSRALASIGVSLERLIARGSRLREYRLLDAAGRELSRADLTRLWLRPAEPYFAVHRRRLHDSLLEALGDQRVDFHSVAEIEPEALAGDRPIPVRISGPGGSRGEAFDLVVGADGVRSGLRRLLWPAAVPRPLGWWTWRCVLDYDRAEPEAQVVYSGLGGVFLYMPLGGGQIYVYAAYRRADDAIRPERGHGRSIAARFGGFAVPRPLVDAIAALPDGAFHAGPLEEVPHEVLGGAGRGRAVLVGDALHACSPSMAQGVSLAAEDAAVLAEIVRTSGGIGVPERFWERRLPRIRHVQAHARRRDRLVARRAESALFRGASNLIIRWRGGDRLQREAFAWLLEHRP
jgi:2-polyprenyl-6-methoxyphenol hydroxylase-like FAD-dependent oxidoreductase